MSFKSSEYNISNIALSGLIFDALRIKRRTNIKFNLDEILDMEGDTGPYVLYNVVRIRSIYRNYIGKFSKLENKNIDFTLLSNKKEKEIKELVVKTCYSAEHCWDLMGTILSPTKPFCSRNDKKGKAFFKSSVFS